ncbi:MAG: thioredoxin fold domain-containing protein [Azospirillum sp.]|nr:thioredoxin fold domain-containing protein [Azospirillum sp.]
MLTRRAALASGIAVGAGAWLGSWPGCALAAVSEPPINDDGLYEQPWFLKSFLDLREDLEGAAAAGKRFAVMWEQKGCPYCKETHLVNFADPAINDYVRQRFDILQLNIWGARPVTDFAGAQTSERALARAWGIRFTPTIQFFPDQLDGATEEVARMPGYFKPPHFLAMFRFVAEKAYQRSDFRTFLKSLDG